ncbi:MAG: rhodanese-like domain-containing protein [Zhongshania sp.]|uniref:sulfurtransferase n=1 Tax=Zhongshania sp. TaxID=1971902 RepID=UPI002638865F|nr:rhodanese-like domain-containing protein [Zhongshania sp.]MDF1693113.1 rhodanese-like domain-containing protein [Zhongshania sp.]
MKDWPLVIEATQLADSLHEPNLLILDTSSADNYAKHHVPGAVHIAPAELQCGIKPAAGKLPSVEQLQALFSRVGLTPGKHVIVYDDEGGGWAGRLIWTLDVIGHRNYSYLNGGLQAWLSGGHPSEEVANLPPPSEIDIILDSAPIAEIEDFISLLDNGQLAIWDARSPEEYRGEKVLAQRGGHIPGAINLDWLELIDRDNHMRLKDLKAVQAKLDILGLSADKTIITHCQTHHRSGLSYLVMKILGYPHIKGYHGSWGEWGNRDDTPIEIGDRPQPSAQQP